MQFHFFPLELEPVYKGHALFTPGSLSGNLLILGSFCSYLELSSNTLKKKNKKLPRWR